MVTEGRNICRHKSQTTLKDIILYQQLQHTDAVVMWEASEAPRRRDECIPICNGKRMKYVWNTGYALKWNPLLAEREKRRCVCYHVSQSPHRLTFVHVVLWPAASFTATSSADATEHSGEKNREQIMTAQHFHLGIKARTRRSKVVCLYFLPHPLPFDPSSHYWCAGRKKKKRRNTHSYVLSLKSLFPTLLICHFFLWKLLYSFNLLCANLKYA